MYYFGGNDVSFWEVMMYQCLISTVSRYLLYIFMHKPYYPRVFNL